MNLHPKDGSQSFFPATCRLGVKGSAMKKTNKKTSKGKTSSSKAGTSKTNSPSVSKFFQRNNEQDKKESETQANSDTPLKNNKNVDSKNIFNNSASDDDFRTPIVLRKRNDLAWKLNKDPKQQKTTPKKRRNKKVRPPKNSTIQIIKENFENTGANPDHLQMAIALSKSTYEAEHGHSSDAVSKEETPNISQILQNAKSTNLERFGFKSGKRTLDVENRRTRMASSEQSKRMKNRFKYITPTLNLRSTKDRESLITSKIDLILNQPQPIPKEPLEHTLSLCSKIREFHCENRSVFRLDRIYERNCFYVDSWNLPKNTYKCGCLLKDWNSIPGREKSPNKHDRTENKMQSLSKSSSAEESTSRETLMSDNKDSGFTSFSTRTTSSISSSYRCISPDLFGSDDEQYNEDLNVNIMDIDRSIEAQLEKSIEQDVRPSETIDLTDEDINKSNSRPASFYSLDEFEIGKADVNMETKCTSDIDENVIINGDSRESNSFRASSDNICSPENPNHEAVHNESLAKNEQSLECIEISDESLLDHHCEDVNTPSPSHSSERCDIERSRLTDKETIHKPAINQSFNSNKSLEDYYNENNSFNDKLQRNANDECRPEILESPISQKINYLSSPCVDHNEQSLESIEILDDDHHCEDVNVLSQSRSSDMCGLEQNQVIEKEKHENIHSPCSYDLDNLLNTSDIGKHKYLSNEESSPSISLPKILHNSLSDIHYESVPTQSPVFDEEFEDITTKVGAESDLENSLNNSNESAWKTEKSTVNSSMEDTPKTSNTNRLSSCRNSDIMCNSAHLNVTDYVNQLLNQDNFSFDNNCAEICEENEELSLSQGSQGSIVDEELNYSSHFATPGKFQNQTPKSQDVVVLDDLSDEIDELPVLPKHTSIHKLPLENTETTTKKSISTPDNYIIKAKNVTPMPDYANLTTPLVKKELEKIGVKPLKRTKGVNLLKYIYKSTHPLVGSVEVLENDSEDDGRVIKRRKISCEVFSPEIRESIEIIGDQITGNEKLEDLIFERRRSVKIPSCQVPLQIIWHNFLSCNPDIKENILLYEPLQLESLHMMLKEQGFKFHVQDLLTFLDKKCITIRTAQKQSKKHR